MAGMGGTIDDFLALPCVFDDEEKVALWNSIVVPSTSDSHINVNSKIRPPYLLRRGSFAKPAASLVYYAQSLSAV